MNPCIAANQNYDAYVGDYLRRREEIISITSNENELILTCEAQNSFVSGSRIHQLTKLTNLVSHGRKGVGQIIRNVVVKKEPHKDSPELIWRATSRSISPL